MDQNNQRVVFVSCMLICLLINCSIVVPQVEARAFFVFGDSLVDNGNNNYLATTARADSYPYGIDYPTHRATGRFSNGLNMPDLISERIGSEPTLPYLSPELNGEALLVGANFASAGIGILNDTGIQFFNIIRITRQLQYFEQYQQRVSALIGEEETVRLVNEALYLMTLGGNDFVNNYFLVPFSARSRQFRLPDYVVYLISEYRKILARLYELGARRVLVTGTGPLGCVPAELAQHSRNGECYAELQEAANLFNPQLVDLLGQLNSEIGSDVFISANAFAMNMDFISDPRAYGLELGLEPTLPYLSPLLVGEKLLIGANFASAGIGILNDTGFQFIHIIRIYKQLRLFELYQKRVSAHIGSEGARNLVNRALVLITLGGNDFVNNYYLVPFSARSRQFSLPDYVRYLISEYRKVLRRLYDLGARRVLVTGTGPMGCAPAELAMRGGPNGQCSVELERAASLYNPQLVDMIRGLNQEIGSDIFVAADAYRMHMDYITNPQAYGFATSKVACCGQGPYNGLGLCTPVSNLCPNRDLNAFWDAFHPSEKANKIIVNQILRGSAQYMYPMNLSTIMAIDSRT